MVSVQCVWFQEIKASLIDFWNEKEEKLKFCINTGRYPPSFQVTIISEEALDSTFIKIMFETDLSGQFYFNLPLQLPKKLVPPSAQPSRIHLLGKELWLSHNYMHYLHNVL